MKIQHSIIISVLSGGIILFGSAYAQQSSSPTTQNPPASGSQAAPAAKTQAPASSKTAPSTTAKRTPAPVTLKTDKDKVSYAIGMNIGRNMHMQSVDIDPAILLRGLNDELASRKTLMTDMEMQSTLMQLQQDLRKKAEEAKQQAMGTNKKEGESFLAENKTKPGVVTLPSGLQYKILTQGTGPKPAITDSVVCNYRGTLINGKEFDSSYKRGQPATFPVGKVIKGWTEALQLMPVGSKWQLFIPPDLAYGERGAGSDIGPDATLIFEVELISIAKTDQNQ
jgi:FKBP-type peptidyl-prolyl cis-trans isomerase